MKRNKIGGGQINETVEKVKIEGEGGSLKDEKGEW